MRARTFAVFLLGAALLAPHSAIGGEKLSLRADLWCPYTCAPESDKPGYLVEIARAILAPEGIEVDYQLMPWKRVLASFQAGEIDGAAGAGPNEFPGALIQSVSLGANFAALAVRESSNFVYRGADSLERLTIGVVTDYTYDDGAIDAYIRRHRLANDGRIEAVYGEDAEMQNFRKLLSKRIDAVIDDEEVLRYTLSRFSPRPPLKLIRLGPRSETYIALSPRNPRSAAYSAMLSAGLIALRRSGRLKAILARYNLTDWDSK